MQTIKKERKLGDVSSVPAPVKSKPVLMAMQSGKMPSITTRRRRIPPRPVASGGGQQQAAAGLARTSPGAGADRCFQPWGSGRNALRGGCCIIRRCSFETGIAFLSNKEAIYFPLVL